MKIMIFDVETTGLPIRGETDPRKQPRIVQFAAIVGTVSETDQTILWERENTIEQKLDPGIDIPYQTSQIHGIYNVDVKWMPKSDTFLKEIVPLMNEVDYIVAHNLKFDEEMIRYELARLNLEGFQVPDLVPKGRICTMTVWTPICKLPSKGAWYKKPKLMELFQFLFDKHFVGAHDALVDVKACGICLIELMRKKHVTLKQIDEKQIQLF